MTLDNEPLYCAEQIKVPPELAQVLKDYTKEVIRRQPEDLIEFSAHYFSNLANIIPAQHQFPPPSISQISHTYKAVANSAVRTCEMDLIRREALASGISEVTFERVVDIAQLGSSAAVDPVEVCALLVTAATSDVRSLVSAVVDVFGETGAINAELCHEVFVTLARHDSRFGRDFQAALEERLDGVEQVAHHTLVEMPCVKAMS